MISIVIPVYNEEESLPHLYKELQEEGLLQKNDEIIFVDDGSSDSSLTILKNIAKNNKTVRVFSLRKHTGKAEALTLGFQKAKEEIIITLDADLQDKPDQIKLLIAKLNTGYDLVCGWRKNRKDSLGAIASSKLFNLLTRTFWGLYLHDYNCGLKAYESNCAKSLRLYGGLHRFIPLLSYEQGFKVTEVAVIHQSRKYGKSKYGISKLWKDLPDMFTMLFLTRYGKKPLHFFGMMGWVLSSIGILILFYLAIIHARGEAVTTRPLFFLGIVLLLTGLQVFFTGFLADLIINKSQAESSNEQIVKYQSD